MKLPLPESDGLGVEKGMVPQEESTAHIIIAENRCSAGKTMKSYLQSSLRIFMG